MQSEDSIIINIPQNFTDPTVSCCDLCDPSLLNQTRPAPPSRVPRKKNATPGVVDKELKKAIIKWRKDIWTRDFGDALFGPSAVLSDAAVESVSSFGRIDRLIVLESALGGYWAWFGRYGDELLNLFRNLEVAPKQAKPTKPRAPRTSKRAVETALGEEGGSRENEAQTKRRRTVTVTPDITPTPVHPRPARSTLPPPTTFRPPAQGPQPQMVHPSLLAHNPYAALATPPIQFYQNPQTPYTPFPYPYYYYPTNTPSGQPNIYYNQYPRNPPQPPPST